MYKLMSRLKKVKITRGKNVFKLQILPSFYQLRIIWGVFIEIGFFFMNGTAADGGYIIATY